MTQFAIFATLLIVVVAAFILPPLWLGLRAPSLDGRAFLVGGSTAELFKPGSEPAAWPQLLLAWLQSHDWMVQAPG